MHEDTCCCFIPSFRSLSWATSFLLDTGGSEIVDCPRESVRARV